MHHQAPRDAVKDTSGFDHNGTLGSATSGRCRRRDMDATGQVRRRAYLYTACSSRGVIAPTTIGQGIYLPQDVDVDGNWTLSVWARLKYVTNNTSGTIYCQKSQARLPEPAAYTGRRLRPDYDCSQGQRVSRIDAAQPPIQPHGLASGPLVGVGNNKPILLLNGCSS